MQYQAETYAEMRQVKQRYVFLCIRVMISVTQQCRLRFSNKWLGFQKSAKSAMQDAATASNLLWPSD